MDRQRRSWLTHCALARCCISPRCHRFVLLTDSNIDALYGKTLLNKLKEVSGDIARRRRCCSCCCGFVPDSLSVRRRRCPLLLSFALSVQIGLDVIYLVLPPGEQTKCRETKAMIEVRFFSMHVPR